MSTDPTVIVAGARTPMGRMSGSLKGFSGSDLGGLAIRCVLELGRESGLHERRL